MLDFELFVFILTKCRLDTHTSTQTEIYFSRSQTKNLLFFYTEWHHISTLHIRNQMVDLISFCDKNETINYARNAIFWCDHESYSSVRVCVWSE